jgi:hypothetical protein
MGMRTRGKSQSAPMQWIKIPVLVKIFKLIVYELGHYLEASSAEQDIEVIICIVFFLFKKYSYNIVIIIIGI